MNLRSKVVSAIAIGACAFLGFASRAEAGPMLDFGVIAPTTGTISYNGTGGPLVGSGLDVGNVVGLNTPLNASPLPTSPGQTCVDCILSFTTGNFASSTTTPIASWIFNAGGTISIVGGVDLTGDGDADDAGDIATGTTLLSGSFINAPFVTVTGGNFRIAGAAFVDTKDATLLDFYGLPNGIPYNGGFNISFMATGSPPNGFTSSEVLSGDVVNEPVNIPSSILLIGSGLIGFVFLHTRHRRV